MANQVGGEQLDAFLLVGDTGARIVACGMISQYNTTEPYGLKVNQHLSCRDHSQLNNSQNMFQIVAKTMTMTGFLTTTLGPAYLEAFHRDMPKWLASGEIKSIEHITDGLEKAPEAFIGMLQGQNVGKAIVRVADA
jgi:NADPH-dependent curcumin reductase CurA